MVCVRQFKGRKYLGKLQIQYRSCSPFLSGNIWINPLNYVCKALLISLHMTPVSDENISFAFISFCRPEKYFSCIACNFLWSKVLLSWYFTSVQIIQTKICLESIKVHFSCEAKYWEHLWVHLYNQQASQICSV